MSAADDAAALLAEYAPKRRCKVGDSPHVALIDALIAQGAAGRLIERILAERYGLTISFNTVVRHRRRLCGCPK